jgi:hypothetical protein
MEPHATRSPSTGESQIILGEEECGKAEVWTSLFACRGLCTSNPGLRLELPSTAQALPHWNRNRMVRGYTWLQVMLKSAVLEVSFLRERHQLDRRAIKLLRAKASWMLRDAQEEVQAEKERRAQVAIQNLLCLESGADFLAEGAR